MMINWFLKSKLCELMVKGLSKINMHFANKEPIFPMEDYHRIVNRIDCDDPSENAIYTFSVSNSNSNTSKLIRKITDGHFNHAGLITFHPTEDNPLAFHVTTKGLVQEDFLEAIRHADYVCVNKIVLTDENFKKAIARMNFLTTLEPGVEYDYNFSFDNDKFYCSEAMFYILDGLYDDIDLKPEMIYGVNVFSPGQVFKIGEIVYSNHPKING